MSAVTGLTQSTSMAKEADLGVAHLSGTPMSTSRSERAAVVHGVRESGTPLSTDTCFGAQYQF